ncbi:MAG: hypothetical protein JOZ15_10390 [Acidobacteria bacterium]|nr:hypothetical protein [Acidobacteriota bacterium]
MQLLGLALVGGGAQAKVDANGHAVDAMNYYNDAVGALGATCDDLTYPRAAGPAPGEMPPPPPPLPPQAPPPPPPPSPPQ